MYVRTFAGFPTFWPITCNKVSAHRPPAKRLRVTDLNIRLSMQALPGQIRYDETAMFQMNARGLHTFHLFAS